MAYDFAKDAPTDRTALRERLQRMSNKELWEYDNACKCICSPKANFGKPLKEEFVIQLEEARGE